MSFPTTNWAILAKATVHGDDAGRRAMGELCEIYWNPVYVAVRASGMGVEDAKDQTQSFFRCLMENSTLRKAERARGKFRSFLLTVLWRFLRDERDKTFAKKRGGDTPIDSLENVMEGDLPQEAAPMAEALDREWGLALFERVMAIMRAEVAESRGEEVWETLRQFLPGSLSTPPMGEAAAALGLTESGLRSEVHRLRQRCREVLRFELITTVSSPDEIHDELVYLGRVLRMRWGGAVAEK